MVVWRSSNVVCRMSEVTVCQDWLVLGWVTIFGQVYHLSI